MANPTLSPAGCSSPPVTRSLVTNVWKNDPGFAGVVADSNTENPMSDVTMMIYDYSNTLIRVITTNQNGVYPVRLQVHWALLTFPSGKRKTLVARCWP